MNPERRRPPRAFADRLAAKVARVAPDRFTELDDHAAFLARYGASGGPGLVVNLDRA